MNVKDLPFRPRFFDRYIALITEETDFLEGLMHHSPEKIFSDTAKLLDLGNSIYAPGKWTVKDILQHCIDTERIIAYRALSISRGETVNLPGFDENNYAENTPAATRTVHDLLEEYKVVRTGSYLLFHSMTPDMLLRKGTANGVEITPLALAYVIMGHPLHHACILSERYYPLLG